MSHYYVIISKFSMTTKHNKANILDSIRIETSKQASNHWIQNESNKHADGDLKSGENLK